jgi:hypothetical protein
MKTTRRGFFGGAAAGGLGALWPASALARTQTPISTPAPTPRPDTSKCPALAAGLPAEEHAARRGTPPAEGESSQSSTSTPTSAGRRGSKAGSCRAR